MGHKHSNTLHLSDARKRNKERKQEMELTCANGDLLSDETSPEHCQPCTQCVPQQPADDHSQHVLHSRGRRIKKTCTVYGQDYLKPISL